MSKKKKAKKKIPEEKNSRTPQIPKPSVEKGSEKTISFLFAYPDWLKSYKNGNFTTFLKDESMYGEHMTYLFSQLIPRVSADWKNNSSSTEFKHCHKIDSSSDAFKKYKNAIKQIHTRIDLDNLEIWQLGFKGNPMRLICHNGTQSNCLIPLLIDQHHLGYESQKHNQKDYKKYKFCPIEKYKK